MSGGGCKPEQPLLQQQQDDAAASDEGRPTLRLCRIPASTPASAVSCGFHISRTQWDPYPWVSAVEVGSVAEQAGMRAGDCVLEVNGEDVLGQRIGEVAAKVRAGRARDQLQLLVWNAGCDPGAAVTLTAGSGPTPLNLQLLSSCLQQCGQLLECPVCLEAVTPPVWQCCHGHLLCAGCRARSERCPLCRVPLGPRGRSLLADKLHELLGQTYRRYSEQRQGSAPPTPPAGPPGLPAPPNETPTIAADDAPAAASDTNEPRAHVLKRGLRLTASSEDVSDAVDEGAGLRSRSLSAGHIGTAVGKDDPAGGSRLVFCPYGSSCSTTFPASEVFHHLREDHDGPLTQYFPREHRELSLPHPARGSGGSSSLTVLTTKAGDTVFLHTERGCMWLWALTSSPTTSNEPGQVAAEPPLCVHFPEDILAPVFPLSTSSDEAIASGRCVRVPDRELRISVRLGSSPSATIS